MIPIIKQGAFDSDVENAINLNFQQMAGLTTGNILYVDPFAGYDGNSGQYPSQAYATLQTGFNNLREGKNDILALISNGLTTSSMRISSAFTWSKNAAHLIGVSSGVNMSNRSRIAPVSAVTAFANFFVVSGSGCLFSNIEWFDGFNTGTTAQICLTVSGGRNMFYGCHIAGMGDTQSATDAGSRNLLISGTGENQFLNCTIGLDTITRTGANASVEFSGATPRNEFINCVFPFLSGDGATLGMKVAAADGIDRFQMFKNCLFVNGTKSGGTAIVGLATMAAAAGGMIILDRCTSVGVTAYGTDATTKAQMFLTGPATSNASGIGVNPA